QLGEESISLTRILTIALTIVALWVGVSWFVRILKSRFLHLTEAQTFSVNPNYVPSTHPISTTW
ncbi:hypothetical protein, partial [Okeania sp. SIO2G4]|uniref:hypothetical protein n=1 Tax=Okeania sp. SIO2G4 TaxID=2607793 RepID=UPI00257E4BB9